ncbi:GNAT family N-acetyltransferase [Shimia thalassica]|uniref:GNAT family N-acetyltransferase n=1 Tax=Shimia thalassica TaxID=1715693 RepID=UPI002734C3A6|nr:GNAT family N-acetyltransferase [Shimia thalassica]MDP2517904.1 GNAT family N-acetyltransferase [Shimia thalassica]
MNLRLTETEKTTSVTERSTPQEYQYVFQSFEALSEVPADEVKAIVLEHSEVMHRRLMQIGQFDNDPKAHVAAFMDKIEGIIPPNGRFYIVRDELGIAVGFGAIRKLDDTSVEMKHLYVRDDHRGSGLGRRLVERRLEDARTMGAKAVFADTIGAFPEMPTLYRSLGFERIDPPVTSGTLSASPSIAECLIFFRKDL